MNFFGSRFFMGFVFVCGVCGCGGVVWVTCMRYVGQQSFPWELWLLGLFWFWGAWSTGKRLFKRKPP